MESSTSSLYTLNNIYFSRVIPYIQNSFKATIVLISLAMICTCFTLHAVHLYIPLPSRPRSQQFHAMMYIVYWHMLLVHERYRKPTKIYVYYSDEWHIAYTTRLNCRLQSQGTCDVYSSGRHICILQSWHSVVAVRFSGGIGMHFCTSQ